MDKTRAKVVLVTGASSGFGRMMAQALSDAGHQVFGTSRSPQRHQTAFPMLALDVTDERSAHACMEQLMAQAGRLDVLINNAGAGLSGAVEDCSLEEVRWQMETNFFGPVLMMRLALAQMRQQGRGRIITIGSLAGHLGLPYQGAYSASKHALEGLNEALRLELSGSEIQSTIICPGDFATGFTDARRFAEQAESPRHRDPMRRVLDRYERDERNGADPALLARLVLRLVNARRLRVRYRVGRWDQRFGLLLKPCIPAAWFEALFRRLYQLHKRSHQGVALD